MSRFLRQSLMPGEKIVRIAKFHWFYTATSFIIFALLTAMGSGLSAVIERFGTPSYGAMQTAASAAMASAAPWPLYLGAGLGGIIFVWRWLVKATTEIVLTDKRFLFKRGVFAVRTEKMAVREVNYCEIRQSLLGNLFDYGSVYVYTLTLDDDNILLPEIAKPNIFTSLIERVKKGEAPQSAAALQQSQATEAQRHQPQQD